MRKKILAGLLSIACVSSFAAVEDDIKGLMQQGKFAEAYQLGKQSPDRLGDPAFDFFFGIAALDAGSPGEGVLALERYTLAYPENRNAWFNLARGYFILGEDQRARTEFENLRGDASGEELISIERFLDAIRARESRYIPTATFYAEAGLGHDSNVNAGIKAGSVAGLPGFIIGAGTTQEKSSDWFQTVLVGAQGTLPVAPGVALYGGVQGGGRWHNSVANDIFDQRNLGVQGGVSLLQGRNLYRFGADYSLIDIDHQSYLNVFSVVGEWNHQFDQFNRFSLSAQWSQLSYENITVFADKQKTQSMLSGADQRDGNLYNLTAGWVKSFSHPWNPVLSMSVNLGQERNSQDRHDMSRDIYGTRGQLSMQPLPKWSVNLGLNYQHSRYDDEFTLTTLKRRDHYLAGEFALSYAVDRNWSVRGEYTYGNQQSNLGLYDYDRHVIAAKLRYDFK